MIIYDFVIRGFICSMSAELSLSTPFSPILRLLVLGYGYCYAAFLLGVVNFIMFID